MRVVGLLNCSRTRKSPDARKDELLRDALREIIYISYKIWDQGPRIGIPCCIVLHFLCRNVSKLVVIGYSGEGTKILYLSII